MKFQMTQIAAATALALASAASIAAPVNTGGVFNMYSQDGLDQSQVVGNGESAINVDATIAGVVDYDAGTWAVSSTAPFYGLQWTASNGTLVKTAGDYVLNTTTGAISAAPLGAVASDGMMHFTVGAGQLGGAIDFAWSTNTGIRVVNVWNINPNGSLTAASVPGMENGPFGGFNAAFNFSAANLAPVPEASTYGMMLAGLGLVGFAVRRRKLMA